MRDRLFQERKWWEPLSHFAGHIVIGALLFCMVATPAVGLGMAVAHFKTLGVPEFTVTVLTFLEHTVLIGDVILFLVYTSISGVRFIREMTL